MATADLIAIPWDPARRYALRCYWPGQGHWDWTAQKWGPFGPACLLPFTPGADDIPGGAPFVQAVLPVAPAPYLAEYVVLDPAGNPAETAGTVTIEPT